MDLEELYTYDDLSNDLGLIYYMLTAVNGESNPQFPLIIDVLNPIMDYDYFVNHSATKRVSAFVKKLIKQAELQFTDHADIINYINGGLSYIIYNRFGVKWKKLFDALNENYKPLENYSMKQVRTPDITKENTGSLSIESSAKTGIFGMNGTTAKDSGINSGKQDNTSGNTETETGTETIERSGNIGVTSSQQMLEQEFEVRKHDLCNLIYNDIDSIMCLKIY